MWNEAFREIGLDDALMVYQQDANTSEYMNKDPEDSRYNFFRWNASEQEYAIGPSRNNPLTGEILDADVVWHQRLTRALRGMIECVTEELRGADVRAGEPGLVRKAPQLGSAGTARDHQRSQFPRE